MLLYLLKANIALTICYLIYRFGLRRLTFYTLNRFFLLAGIAFSAILPLIDVNQLLNGREIDPQMIAYVPDWQGMQLAQVRDEFTFWKLLIWLFWAGVIVMGIRLFLQLYSLWKVHRTAENSELLSQQVKVLCKAVNPFSFFKNIYINPELHTVPELKAILQHEQVHVQQWHTIDILAGEVNNVFYWFNPGAWMMRMAIRENLEFITDRKMLQQGIDAKAYQYSLIKVSGIPYATAIANNFNFSHLKSRIMMMNKKRSSRYHLLRYVVLGGMAGAILLSLNLRPDAFAQQPLPDNDVPGVIMPDAHQPDAGKVKLNWLGISEEELSKGIHPLFVIDGTEMDVRTYVTYVKEHGDESHYKVKAVKAADAIRKYGKKGEHGAFIISSHQGKSKLPAPPPPPPPAAPPVPPANVLPPPPPPPAPAAVHIKPAPVPKPVPAPSAPNNAVTVTAVSTPKVEVTANSTTKAATTVPTAIGVVVTGNTTTAIADPVVVTATGKPTVKIRGAGNAQPLYVLDGVKVGPTQPEIAPEEIESINVVKGANADVHSYGEEAKNGIIFIWTKKGSSKKAETLKGIEKADDRPNFMTTSGKITFKPGPSGKVPLVILDGKETPMEEVNSLDPKMIHTVNVIKNGAKQYGEKAENGVIMITTKKAAN